MCYFVRPAELESKKKSEEERQKRKEAAQQKKVSLQKSADRTDSNAASSTGKSEIAAVTASKSIGIGKKNRFHADAGKIRLGRGNRRRSTPLPICVADSSHI